MGQFLAAVLTLSGLGLFFALVLTYAAKKFAVLQEPKINAILEKLPGTNCGGCGMAGCAHFAQALMKKEVALENCKACSSEQAAEIARILGVQVLPAEKMVASLRCHGGKNAQDKYIYQGLKDCLADAQLLGGHKLCRFACLGWGRCMRACPFGAIQMSAQGLPQIAGKLCTGCGRCVASCPRNLLVLIPAKARVYVGCSSGDPAKEVVRVCTVGCIACKKCVQACPFEAIKVGENLAIIDYDKCTSCGKCVEVCPRKIIMAAKPLPYRNRFQPNSQPKLGTCSKQHR